MAATLAPNSWTANTTRPPRTWVKYARSAATSRLGVYRKSSCWKGAAWSAMHGTGPRRVLERGLPLWARAGTGGRANNPVHQLGHREGPAGLVLQRGQPNVLAWITELQGNLEHPGEQLMPLGPGLHPHSAKPAEASVWAQSMPIRGGSRGSTGSLGCQLVSTSRPPGRSSRHASRADAVGVSGKMQRVNGDHGVGRAIGQAGSGQVADDEPGPLGQPEQHRPVGRLLDGNGREVHPGSAGRRAPGPTTAQDRPGRSPGRPVSSQARGRERRPHDQQADRDKGVRLDLLWQVGAGGLPDSPQARGSGHGGELLVELGGRGRWRLVAGGRAAVLVLRHPSSSRRWTSPLRDSAGEFTPAPAPVGVW